MAKRKPKAAKPASTTGVNPRVAARMELKKIRTRINAMTNQQVKGFFKGFPNETLDLFVKMIGKVKEDKRQREIARKRQQIAALEQQIEELGK